MNHVGVEREEPWDHPTRDGLRCMRERNVMTVATSIGNEVVEWSHQRTPKCPTRCMLGATQPPLEAFSHIADPTANASRKVGFGRGLVHNIGDAIQRHLP